MSNSEEIRKVISDFEAQTSRTSPLSVRLTAFDYICGIVSEEAGQNLILTNKKLLDNVIDAVQPSDVSLSTMAIKTLINLSASNDSLSQTIIAHDKAINTLTAEALNPKSDICNNSSMLLRNLTTNMIICHQYYEHLKSKTDVTIFSFIDAFFDGTYEKETTTHISNILRNLMQCPDVRRILSEKREVIKKFTSFLSPVARNDVRYEASLGLMHNLCWQKELHEWLLTDNSVGILTRLLEPLAGPEEFDDDEMEKLPIELQYLPGDKKREPVAEIRKLLIQTIHRLTVTKFGRDFIKDNGAYYILRELHKVEEHPGVMNVLESCIYCLIQDIEDKDDLDKVEIPSDIEEKLMKEHLEIEKEVTDKEKSLNVSPE
ncbi:DgyrCDS10121 [Dimorphilus gyrociliatus]|uniref:Protein HGH1 homolog n=1 Tax=Dimorphilus gyrociliatus TaxID=2664684 RepID=A0A7I8VZ62_9ANNE|nr:DgyrCDS10121 [Dimorphilus gyrociliatus]